MSGEAQRGVIGGDMLWSPGQASSAIQVLNRDRWRRLREGEDRTVDEGSTGIGKRATAHSRRGRNKTNTVNEMSSNSDSDITDSHKNTTITT